MKPTIIIFFAVVFFKGTHGVSKLPSYIEGCSRKDKHFNDCAVRNGNAAIPRLAEGDATYHIPVLEPLYLEAIDLTAGNNLKLYTTNTTITGFETANLKDVDWNFEKKTIYMFIHIPLVSTRGHYRITGKLLLLQLDGQGPMNFTFTGINITVNINYDMIMKSGKEYGKIIDLKAKPVMENSRIYLGNLLNNENISKHMNIFINENWREFFKEMDFSVSKSIEAIVMAIVGPLIDRIPFNEIVKP